jgi:hypothetical protein
MLKRILQELHHHAPFTALGALGGIVFMFIFRNIPEDAAHELFYVFHPIHVLLSALATAGMYRRYSCPTDRRGCNLLLLLFIGYTGSIGIATLSDSIMPYVGEVLLRLPHPDPHLGFIERWWLISTLAIVGIIIAYVNPQTKFPHSAHVMVSTWASLFHILMAMGKNVAWYIYVAVFLFLFLAVWLPCCISDIVFPLLFIKKPTHPQP